MSGERRFTVQGTNNSFTCANCGTLVHPLQNGSVRNHCPACLHSLHVDVMPGDLGQFDLIVLSELGYYFDPAPWQQTAEQAARALTPAGTIVACHWMYPFADRRISTRHVHAAIARQPGLHRQIGRAHV